MPKKNFEMMQEDEPKEPKKHFEIKPQKRFEIREIKDQGKKRFEIKAKKKFEIQIQQNTPITLEWFQQDNAHDCGPCLLLNGLQMLQVQEIPQSIEQVRREVNGLRRQEGRPELSQIANFTSEDIGKYLSEIAGLNVQEYPCLPYEADNVMRSIEQNLESDPYDMIYMTNGTHFRGLLPGAEKEGEFLLLDSLTDAPRAMNENSSINLVRDNVYAQQSSDRIRMERVGIVRKHGEAGYRLINL